MKRFLIRSFLFFLIAIGLIASVTVAINLYVAKKALFKCRDDARYIVLGNSHPEQTFNDSLIDHLQNVSQAAETYIYTYSKTRKIIEQNRQIETVFLEFSNTDLMPEWNKWIWGSGVLNWRYPIYSPFMDLGQEKLLLSNNFSGVTNCLALSLKDNLSRIIHHDLSYAKEMGGFVYNTRQKTDSILQNSDIKRQLAERKEHQHEISSVNLFYLEKLVQYLTANKKRLLLIRCPLHKSYPGFGNEDEYQKILHDHFSGIEYLDFKDFPLPNADYVDLEHLNYLGARKFSVWFNELIKEGLLEKENKQQFIDEKIREIQ